MSLDFIKPVEVTIDGKTRHFDLNDPKLPKWVDDNTMTAGNYPYKNKLSRKDYENDLEDLQMELVKLQGWLQETGERLMIIFEGRDAAGKGGSIKALTQYLNPRHANVIALSKPSDREQGQWYYQRYIRHFPTSGEIVIFDRSWYNRAGVEPVMGFCTKDQHQHFLEETPRFEKMLTHEGIHFFKFWLNVGQETQLERFHDRRHDPLRTWKLSPMDLKALTRWEDYTKARNLMMQHTHIEHAPWTIIRSNDKRRARLNMMRHLLISLDYTGKKEKRIGKKDEKVIGQGPDFFNRHE